jgi:hypothetical protein
MCCRPAWIFRLPGLTTKFGNHLDADDQPVNPETNTVLVRLDTNQYLHVGEYRVTHAGSFNGIRMEDFTASPNVDQVRARTS